MIVLGRQFLAAINLYKENYVKKNANFQKTLKVISKLIMLLKLLRKAYVVCTCIFNFFCIIDSMTFSGYCFVIIFHPLAFRALKGIQVSRRNFKNSLIT